MGQQFAENINLYKTVSREKTTLLRNHPSSNNFVVKTDQVPGKTRYSSTLNPSRLLYYRAVLTKGKKIAFFLYTNEIGVLTVYIRTWPRERGKIRYMTPESTILKC